MFEFSDIVLNGMFHINYSSVVEDIRKIYLSYKLIPWNYSTAVVCDEQMLLSVVFIEKKSTDIYGDCNTLFI